MFVDDNDVFLNAVRIGLEDKFLLETYNDTIRALERIYQANMFIDMNCNAYSQLMRNDLVGAKKHPLDFTKIFHLIYNENRFNYVSTVIVDYKMSPMNGEEFLSEINDMPLLKVMLSGVANTGLAVRLFNNRLIDKFYPKKDLKLDESFNATLAKIQKIFFQQISTSLLNRLGSGIKSFLFGMKFSNLFTRLVEEIKAVEYYLISETGSFLFLDENAKPTWLIIKDNKQTQIDIGLLKKSGLNEASLQLIEKKQKLAFFLSSTDMEKHPELLTTHLLDAYKLDQEFIFGIAYEKTNNFVEWEKILSYSAYKKNLGENLAPS
ncbi:MAG: hypothetical protein JKY13_03855 [Gammaproteobacteria bacterium]|nr:hypothetical protein [Gammaproteobacteria bacterium]